MLCKKCKTATVPTEEVCGYCGAKLTQKRNRRISFVVLLGIVALLVTYLIYAGNQDWQTEELPAVAKEPSPQQVQAASTPQPAKTEEPTPTSSPDLGKNLTQLRTMLNEVLIAVNKFYEYYSPSVDYVSKNGYLYDMSGETYVKINEIVESMGLNPEYADRNILFFYLRPSDLKGMLDFDVKDWNKFEIFAAYETKDGYMTVSLNSKSDIISGNEIQRILEKYRGEHGPIVRFSSDSDDFMSIVDELEEYNNATMGLGYDVRYMAGDDKYAVVVASPVGSPDVIEEYIFTNTEEDWVICLANFETFERYVVDVNRILPDLNLSLLPNYNMRHYAYRMRNNFAEVINAMKSSGMITDRDGAASFASGTNEFVYLEFQSGVNFVGYLNGDNVWVMFAINSYQEGEVVLQSVTNNPPSFIMKQY